VSATGMRRWAVLFAGLVLVLSTEYGNAQDRGDDANNEALSNKRPANFMVLRLSETLLSSMINRPIDYQIQVRDVILDTPVTGVARLVGQPVIKLEPSENDARFNVVFSGTVHSRTVARSGPAIINGHTITYFTAIKEVAFEPGKGFRAGPPLVYAQSQCYTDSIQSTRGGIVGRIVQRRAANEVAANHDEVVQIARERASRRIAHFFETHMQERLARLSEALEFQTRLAGLRSRDGNRRLIARTTPGYLEIADAVFHDNGPIGPPAIAGISREGPIQVCVNSRLVPPAVAHALDTIFTRPSDSAIVNGLALLPGTFGKQAAAAINAFASRKNIGIEYTDDWLIVDLYPDNTSRIAERIAAPADNIIRR
jgi:hypothetical protein